MIAVIMPTQQLNPAPGPAGNMDMVEVMIPPMPWGCAPLNASNGSSTGFVDDAGYNNYSSWSNLRQDVWSAEDWVHVQHSNGSQAVGPAPWMPAVEHQLAPLPVPTNSLDRNQWVPTTVPPRSQERSQRQIQASVVAADDQEAPPIGMRMQLQALQAEDPGSVLIARKLHRLGFNSAQKLQMHFSKYGGVREVLVPHSRVKASPGRRARTRPAAIGFVVMWSAEAANAAIADGNEHLIEGIQINVQAFERRTPDGSQDDGESPVFNSEESSDQEPKFFNHSGLEQWPFTVPASITNGNFETNGNFDSPKARWADISDEDDDSYAHGHISTPMDSPQSCQSNQGGRWADLYGDEDPTISTDCSTPPQQELAEKVHDYPEFYTEFYNNQEYYYNQHHYHGNHHQRRQTGRGRANRGRA